jgi:hypothetical protein
MKHQYTLLAIALTLFANTAWAPAYSSSDDDDGVEIREFEIGDEVSLDRCDSNIEREEVLSDGEVYEVETRVHTKLPQRLIQFRQEGEYYRLYTRPAMRHGFVPQDGLWQYRGSSALDGRFWPCCYRVS